MSDVAVLALGTIEPHVLRAAGESIRRNLGLTVGHPASREWPAFAFNGSRDQYDAVLILRSLAEDASTDAFRVVGIAECDIFIPMLRYVFGLAQLEGRAALVSLARLRQEYYELPQNDAVLHQRVRKEVVHELGHSMGLVHCGDPVCAMAVSTTVEQLDIKGEQLCRSCAILAEEWSKHHLSGPLERLRGG